MRLEKNKTIRKGPKMKKKSKPIDERALVANELYKFLERCEKQGIDMNYSAYIAFCVIGGNTLEHSPETFYRFIAEIIEKNVA